MPDSVQQENDDMAWMAEALHDLCQPLTALQCRLFLGLGEPPAEMSAALTESLEQCDRVMAQVRQMQQRMQRG